MAKIYRSLIFSLMAFLIITGGMGGLVPAAFAQSGSGSTLTGLETKYFEHTYPSDSDEDRTARLEKLIFGESKTGDISSRLAEIQKIVATNDGGSAASVSSSGSSGSSSASNKSSGSNTASSSNSNSGSSSNASTASVPAGNYPRVDALEELLLSSNNKKLPLEKRLGLLEKKAFGHPSSDGDMSARTDALEQYWQKNLKPELNQKYDRALTQLETQVIGQSYPDKPIIERLQTLEGIVFPNEPPDTHSGIKEQIDTLNNAVQISMKQGKKPAASAVDGGSGGGQTANAGAGGYGSYGQAQDTSASSGGASSGSTGNYGSYGQTTPYANSASSAQTGYANTDRSSYAGQPAANNYTNQGQYTNTAQAQTPPANYGQITPFANSPTNNNEQYGGQASGGGAVAEQKQNQGHPLLKGLAKTLGMAAGMAAGAVGTGMMYSGGMGGMGGYGGYGGMGGYGSPYGYGGMGGMGGMGGYGSPYGYGGMGGMGGMGSSLGRWW